LYLDRLLVRQKKYFIPFIIIIGFVLLSILGISSILRIRDSYTIARLAVKVNRLLITSIRGYLVSVSLNVIP
jgi:hypothetical protein